MFLLPVYLLLYNHNVSIKWVKRKLDFLFTIPHGIEGCPGGWEMLLDTFQVRQDGQVRAVGTSSQLFNKANKTKGVNPTICK